jgi:hypothetical protein
MIYCSRCYYPMQILPTVILHGGGDEAQPGGVPAPLWVHLAACASGKSTSPIVNVIAVATVSAAMTSIVEAFIIVNPFFVE